MKILIKKYFYQNITKIFKNSLQKCVNCVCGVWLVVLGNFCDILIKILFYKNFHLYSENKFNVCNSNDQWQLTNQQGEPKSYTPFWVYKNITKTVRNPQNIDAWVSVCGRNSRTI